MADISKVKLPDNVTYNLKDSGAVRKTGDTMTGTLTLYKEGTTAQNYPTELIFQNKDTTTGKTSTGYIRVYDGSEYGSNFVISPQGNMFIGSGESAQNHYNLYTHSTGESFYATADSSMFLQSNGNTIANRVGMGIFTDHTIRPIKADVSTNNVGSIGTSSYKWNAMYATTFYGALSGNASTADTAKSVNTFGDDVVMGTTGSDSDDSGDIAWLYGNGQEKARLWTANDYTTKSGLNYRVYKSDGTQLYSGTIPLADGTGASGTWGISISGNASTISNFRVSTTSNLGIAVAYNAIGYVSGLTSDIWNYGRTDGALYTQRYNDKWQHEIYADYRTGRISVRGNNNGTWQPWKRVIVDDVLTDQDLNDVTIPGFYRGTGDNTSANKPSGVTSFGMMVIHAAGGSYYYQLLNQSGTNNTWRRSCSNGTWGAWVVENINNTDVNVKVNNTNPASGTWYYPVWYTATSGTGNVNANDGFRYYSLQGTASAAGRSIMQVGNGTQTGTAGNKYGEFRIYSQKQGYSTLTMASGATAERKHSLPDVAGTIGVFTATPTSGQVVVSDGTAGGFKTTGYTIAKSVPSNAVFTDSSGNNRVLRAGDNMTGSLTTTGSFIADTQVGAPTIAASSNLYAGDFCKITSSGTTGSNGSAYIRAINDESGTTHTLIKIGNGSISCENSAGTPVSLTASGLELSHATPLIDFHHNSSTQDFTSRIITTNLAELTFYGKNSGGTTVYGTCRGAAFTVVSSKYVKENIKDITTDEAKKLLQLRPVSFDYKYTGETNKRGLIAEEVLEVMPEMVNVPEDYSEPVFDEIPDNVPSIDYSKFVPYLIKMAQIQQQEIDQLKAKLEK